MANDLQNSVYTAIDTIIEKRVEELELDKTVIATVEQLVNAKIGQYRVQYRGGSMYAYAQNEASYAPNTSVYVSIPQNDFSQKKWIVGKVTSIVEDEGLSEISTAINDYQLVGNNTIVPLDKNVSEFGLCSYKPNGDSVILYSREFPENNVLGIEIEKLQKYLSESSALLIEATFRTNLDAKQKNKTAAKYGLSFDLIFENGDATYSTMQKKFEALAPNIKIKKDLDGSFASLADYNDEMAKVVNHTNESDSDPSDDLAIIIAAVGIMREQFSQTENELINLYYLLLEEMQKNLPEKDYYTKEPQRWQTIYYEWFAQSTNTLVKKRVNYSFTSDDMIGNPLLFKIASEQYNIYPIDTGRFQYIEDITFYCNGFNENPDYNFDDKDIFVSNIGFYGLQKLTSTNGDYSLRLGFPGGQIFDSNDSANLEVKATVSYQNVPLTTGINYYWFVKDGRVTGITHKDYHYQGGVGWKYLADNNSKTLVLSAATNTAYENLYKCVVVYTDTVTLKSEFTIYNNENKRLIEIESDLGTTFKFDSGTPVLTCKILDSFMSGTETISIPDKYEDSNYSYTYKYLWIRKGPQGDTFVLDKTYEELKKEYDLGSFDAKLALKNQLNEMENVILNKNQLTYPANKIASNSNVIFECYIYRQADNLDEEAYIGCASIILKNEAAAILNEYYIVIENGDQVFQYTESGVSPCNERFADPVVPKNLICHLFDPNGLEVNSSQYQVKWQYPLTGSLLVPPTEGLKINPSTGLVQWYHEQQAPVAIVESYDYSALDNQITCIVKYDDIQVTKDTEFYFGKVGDNGTNGTDVIAKIEPWVNDSRLDNTVLTLVTTDAGSAWNTGVNFNIATTPLELKLYRRNEYIDPAEYKNVKWTMAGGSTKSNRFTASSSEAAPQLGNIQANYLSSKKYSNYIVKAEAKLMKVDGSGETQTHYAFYPICIIDYEQDVPKHNIYIDKDRTLKHVLYNADGRNPLYNENQGIFFNFSTEEDTQFTVSWEAKGGLTEAEDAPAFDLYYDKDLTSKNTTIVAGTLQRTIKNCPYVYIKPKDVYAGAAQNNHVKATIYAYKTINEKSVKVKIATAYIPIYMSLNLYGLASLNAWDGNTIEINEDENYIMAPQIGAGVKNEDNTFTGVVMGKATTYGSNEEQVGLLGYSDGRQSIFLDAETGNAIFGLPETDDRQQDPDSDYTEGRIELIPGGTSRIAGWNIGSRNLYNITKLESNNQSEDGLLRDDNDRITGYKDDYAKDHVMDIGHQREGIMLSANPAYISIKGKPLIDEEVSTETDRNISVGDSLELQLDPAQASLFSIFAHKNVLDEKTQKRTWKRVLLSGINKKGQFIANTLQNGSSSGGGTTFSIGNVDAFGDEYNKDAGVMRYSYTGAIFGATSDDNILDETKFFRIYADKDEITKKTGMIHIDGGRFNSEDNSRSNSEYARPINIHGAALSLYAGEGGADYPITNHSIEIDTNHSFIGHIDAKEQEKDINGWVPGLNFETTGSFLRFQHKDSSELRSKYHFNTYIGRHQDENDENNWPWLFSESSFIVPTSSNDNANQITRLSLGSIANYAFSNGETDISNDSGSTGHILNYATGSLQLNKAKKLTSAVVDANGETTTPATYGIDKALQINDKNILFGNIDTLETEGEDRSSWAKDAASYVIGTVPLVKSIKEGFRLQADSDGTTLVSKPRVGIYSQNGIDINERSGFGLYLSSGSNEVTSGHSQDSYLLLKSDDDTENSIRLSSKHGYLEFNGNARAEMQGGGASNGAYINPGFHTGYGIFNGAIGDGSYANFSIYAAKKIEAEDFSFHDTLSLNGITSYYVKELLYNHTHPFSKTVTISASEVKKYARISGKASAAGGRLVVYNDEHETIKEYTFDDDFGSLSLPSGADSLMIFLNEPNTSGVTVTTTPIEVTVKGMSGIARK